MNLRAENNVEVNGIEIYEKTNGTIITILLTKYLPEKNISGWFKKSGWFYLTLHEAIIDTTIAWPFSEAGIVIKFETHQVAESVQLNFRLSEPVEDFEILSSNNGKITLTLRQPLTKSFSTIKNVLVRKNSNQIEIECSNQLSRKDALPLGLIFIGGGLIAKGLLRSEKITSAVGLISLTVGWVLNSREQ